MDNVVLSGCLLGLNGQLVQVEADLQPSLPSVTVVGLPNKSIQESKDRIRSAIRAADFSFPRGRVIINLAPADLKKEGSHYDLPMAVSILLAQGVIPRESLASRLFLGELALDSSLRPIRGALSFARLAKAAGLREIYLPAANANEACLIGGIKIKPVNNLKQLVNDLSGAEEINHFVADKSLFVGADGSAGVSLNDVWGQERAKRALLVAAAGGHNILLIGPPGSGKTMLAKALTGLLPAPPPEEIIEIIEIYSAAGIIAGGAASGDFSFTRPYRSPHHTSSTAAMVGGGTPIRPGEITLAHRGVLHLDELPEFNRPVLEALREPLENKEITVVRAAGRFHFPADFILVATMNPCPCGNFGSTKECQCSPARVKEYRSKISGPLLDRIDIIVWLEPELPTEHENYQSGGASESLVSKCRVVESSAIQTQRQFGRNANLSSSEIKKYCQLDAESKILLLTAATKLGLSTRGYTRVLKVARTIADLAKEENIKASHVGEALQYRLEKFI